ncbi:DNA alkylation repair protein [Dysgonomonas sp. 520]|uniref:DNA alkylation repair protein n=1 Tax=Dysgonomonas sp. 520 TaxID=2302931 RepID=UPI0013D61FBD|nr:DNA alkylation repair protein [Dysgonomonas sp. 520]NDW09550.1 hypothetical protein [Dysgonomonas sp. 520]
MTIEDTIKDIRKQCRLAMNGVASTSMRKQGLSYKLNFGVSLPQIKDISKRYEPNADLANKLWEEDTRELKILATLLYPLDEFSENDAKRWLEAIINQEIREQVCFNLFQNLPFAQKVAVEWSNSDKQMFRTTGYWLLGRLLLLKRTEGEIAVNRFSHIISDVESDDSSLRKAAIQLLKYIGRQSGSDAIDILSLFKGYEGSKDDLKREIYDSLQFEFDFYGQD